jgi:alpha-tubulin suppressor-like RCC1 family protein
MKRPLAVIACVLAGCPSAPPPAPDDPTLIQSAGAGEEEAPEDAAAPPPPARLEVSLGRELMCARLDRRIHCWLLGQPKTPLAKLPPVPGIESAVDLAVGGAHACAVTADGKVRCWGDNRRGQLGAGLVDPLHPNPVVVRGIEGATAVASSASTTCALLAGGAVSCWGDNDHGQTGSDVTHTEEANDLVLPTRVPKLSGATALALGGQTSCALLPSGVWCWGRSQLASEKSERKDQSPEPSQLGELSGVQSIVGRDGNFCAVRRGEVVCWGDGAYTLSQERMPYTALRTFGIHDAASVESGDSHACAIFARGEVSCFGVDFNGALGRGVLEQTFEAKPVERVQGLAPVRAVSIGDQTTCAITVNDELWCWGLLPMGPRGPDNPRATPVRVEVW